MSMPGSLAIAGTAPGLADFAIRLLIASALVIVLGGMFRSEIVTALVPALRATIEAADSHFYILALDVTERSGEEVLRLRVELARTVHINGHAAYPERGAWLEVTTKLGTVLQPALIAFIAALSWPAARLREFMVRMILCAALAFLVVLMDTPMDLLAYLWTMFVEAFDREGFYWILAYHEFIVGGGRLALGAVAGAVAITAASRVNR